MKPKALDTEWLKILAMDRDMTQYLLPNMQICPQISRAHSKLCTSCAWWNGRKNRDNPQNHSSPVVWCTRSQTKRSFLYWYMIVPWPPHAHNGVCYPPCPPCSLWHVILWLYTLWVYVIFWVPPPQGHTGICYPLIPPPYAHCGVCYPLAPTHPMHTVTYAHLHSHSYVIHTGKKILVTSFKRTFPYPQVL